MSAFNRWLAAMLCTVPLLVQARTTLHFHLPGAAVTSAGVYDAQSGRLLRTLWRGETLPAGAHRRDWDDRDDAGLPVSERELEFKLIHHRIAHVWEGVIGNSSGSFTGASVHHAFQPPTGIAIDGQRAWYGVGYNEMQPGVHGFALNAPQTDRPLAASMDPFVAYSMLAADATRLYWANTGGLSHTSFVGGVDLATSVPAPFKAGRTICLNPRPASDRCYESQHYAGVIDVETDAAQRPTGLAVQRHGRVLAVAHGAKGVVRLFDKRSGALLRELSLSLNPKASNQVAMTPGGDLWVVSGQGAVRFTRLEGQPTVAATIAGLVQPLAVSADPMHDGGLWVADGGTSQQLKYFDASGRPGLVIGRLGGAATDPVVSDDRLCFRAGDGTPQTAIAAAADSTLWVVDTCHQRMLRYRTAGVGAGRSDAQVAYLPAVYRSTVDHGAPHRVFANFLEFEVESRAPLLPGRSWKLVRNWALGLPPELQEDAVVGAAWRGLVSVETLANGRSFGLVTTRGRQAIVELPAAGPLRLVKMLARPAPYATAKVLYENGDLGHALIGPTTQAVMRQPLTGFDADGDPVWSSEPVRVASVPTSRGTPHYRNAFSGMPPRFPLVESGKLVFFDQSVVGNEGFHLGAAALDGTDWLWQASPSGPLDGIGSFQTKAIDGSLHYGGNSVWAHGRHILYGYHGEFYKDLQNGKVGQANQFMHFDESGLFVGQFGLPSTRATEPAQAGLSGNAFSPTLVRDGNQLYLYHNDESSHGGVHRWRIDGWNDIGDLRGRGRSGETIELR